MENLARSIMDAERIRVALQPPEKLEDVVQPGSLASLVAPARWQPLREIRGKLEASRALSAQIAGKLSEVEETLRGLDARRPRDVAAMADAVLKGDPVAPEPEPAKPQGLAALGREQLTAARDGLRQKKQDLDAETDWLMRQVRIAEADILEEALTKASARYGELVRGELAALHVIIDAGAALLSATKVHPVMDNLGWRKVRILAPPFTDPKLLFQGEWGSRNLLANFEAGSGVSGAQEAWRRAVKAAVGVNAL